MTKNDHVFICILLDIISMTTVETSRRIQHVNKLSADSCKLTLFYGLYNLVKSDYNAFEQ